MKLIHCNADANCKFSASDTELGVLTMATHLKRVHPEYIEKERDAGRTP